MRQKKSLSTVRPHRHLLCVAALIGALSALGQTVQLSQPAEADSSAPSRAAGPPPELPQPEWQVEMGTPVARLRLKAPNSAAWSVAFESLTLAKDAQMFLYGINAGGTVTAVHGPYTGTGPLNVPGFQTHILEGADLIIEVRGGAKFSVWPFTLEAVEWLDATQLAALKDGGLQVEAIYRPEQPQRQTSEVRYAWFDDELLPYRVIDGLAIMGGDIVLGPAAEVESGQSGKNTGRREAHETTRSGRLWPNGVIPYTIEYTPALWQGHTMETRILNAIAHWNANFPGILVKRTSQSDYVTFRLDSKSPACVSALGRAGGQQFITLNMGCTQGHIMHEIGHALGMEHEHQRPDRDTYITVLWENIEEQFKYAFQIPQSGTSRALGAYDFGSIMHYGRKTASIDPWTKDTFLLKVQPPEGLTVGQRTALSTGDVSGVRTRYCNVANWKISPTSILAAGNGGGYTLNVTAPPYCSWTASESVSWILLSATSKTGSGSIGVTVIANFGASRAANIKVQSGTTSRLVRVDQPSDPHNLN